MVVGEIVGAYGVKGWVKIHSFTQPVGNILDYAPWGVEKNGNTRQYQLLAGRLQGQAVIAQLEGVVDRDQALMLKSSQIVVPKDRFPPAEQGQYYWADLVGLNVVNLEGQALGSIHEMLSTGANDVMVVRGDRERLIPFVQPQYVKSVSLDDGSMVVDWDADF